MELGFGLGRLMLEVDVQPWADCYLPNATVGMHLMPSMLTIIFSKPLVPFPAFVLLLIGCSFQLWKSLYNRE